MIKAWNEIKQDGQGHYKTGDVEPIDLAKAGGYLHDGITWNLTKNAYRCRREVNPTYEDVIHCMTEIKHYADMLMSYFEEKERLKIDSLYTDLQGYMKSEEQNF